MEMNSSQKEWAALLPVIQAFVAGTPIQSRSRGFANSMQEWRDTTTIYQIRMCEWRIKPEEYVPGTWFVDYVTDDKKFAGLKAKGTLEFKGDKVTKPEWPVEWGYICDTSTERFEATP